MVLNVTQYVGAVVALQGYVLHGLGLDGYRNARARARNGHVRVPYIIVSIECAVQAEPYNPHDKNAILVSIESPSAKICGNPGLEKAGHIRALAAKIIREAKPQKMAYEAKLCSLSYRTICVQVRV